MQWTVDSCIKKKINQSVLSHLYFSFFIYVLFGCFIHRYITCLVYKPEALACGHWESSEKTRLCLLKMWICGQKTNHTCFFFFLSNKTVIHMKSYDLEICHIVDVIDISFTRLIARLRRDSHTVELRLNQLTSCAFYNWNRAVAIGTCSLSLEKTPRKCFNCICSSASAPPLPCPDWLLSRVLKFTPRWLAERAFCFGCLPAAVWKGRGAVCLPLLGWIDTQWGAEAGETLHKRRCK